MSERSIKVQMQRKRGRPTERRNEQDEVIRQVAPLPSIAVSNCKGPPSRFRKETTWRPRLARWGTSAHTHMHMQKETNENDSTATTPPSPPSPARLPPPAACCPPVRSPAHHLPPVARRPLPFARRTLPAARRPPPAAFQCFPLLCFPERPFCFAWLSYGAFPMFSDMFLCFALLSYVPPASSKSRF